MSVLTATAWPTNAHLIEDVAKLGYLDGRVLDCTYGLGNFWTRWRPEELVALDAFTPAQVKGDFTTMPFPDGAFDSVVYDPSYKLNGTPSEADRPYGVHVAARWQERMDLIRSGVSEACRVTRRYLLVKCMDQVVSGRKVWQTLEIARWADAGLVDRFDLLRHPRPQPPGRRQVHSQGNYSTLLVFSK